MVSSTDTSVPFTLRVSLLFASSTTVGFSEPLDVSMFPLPSVTTMISAGSIGLSLFSSEEGSPGNGNVEISSRFSSIVTAVPEPLITLNLRV